MENIKLICFDLDHTLIKKSSWKELNLALGISVEEDERLYQEHKSELLTYDQWINKILERYVEHEDANRETITKIFSQYSLIDGAREAIEYLKAKGYILVLISGSVDILVDMIAKDLGIPFSKANNTFVFDDNNRLLNIHTYGDDVAAKLAHLESFCEMLGINIKECACIADGANDIEMFRSTGHGITFKNSNIENEAWKVINSFDDLKNIL